MKTLYLLRHAKSSWNDASLRDFDRPLNDRGREAAKRIGERLAFEKLSVPFVIGVSAEERFDERVYEASLGDLLQVVSEIHDDKQAAILIGHNPGLEELLAFLTGEGRRMPTCALAKIAFHVASWRDVRTGGGKLEWFITPKD
jgi:phosphohistidine phosphatase